MDRLGGMDLTRADKSSRILNGPSTREKLVAPDCTSVIKKLYARCCDRERRAVAIKLIVQFVRLIPMKRASLSFTRSAISFARRTSFKTKLDLLHLPEDPSRSASHEECHSDSHLRTNNSRGAARLRTLFANCGNFKVRTVRAKHSARYQRN